MFAGGFLALGRLFHSGEVLNEPRVAQTLKDYMPYEAAFNTNEYMWNVAIQLVGQSYFHRQTDPSAAGPVVKKLYYEAQFSWPGKFLLARFADDMRQNRNILNVCEKIANPSKMSQLRILKINKNPA